MNAQAEICHEHIFFLEIQLIVIYFQGAPTVSEASRFDASVIGTLNTRGWLPGGQKKKIQA
jgi:hypothetical protein